MERDWNDQVEAPAAQARIAQGLAEPFGQRVTQMPLTAVLEVVDEFANQAAAAVGRDGRIEMQNAMLAIRATERFA